MEDTGGGTDAGFPAAARSSQRGRDANPDAVPLLNNRQDQDMKSHGNSRGAARQQAPLVRERKVEQQREREHLRQGSLTPFDIEDGSASAVGEGAGRERQPQRKVKVPTRGQLLLAKPTPFEPITDPFAFVCDVARRPKFGHQYILCPERCRRRRPGDPIGLSVGPHWSGVIYTMSMIGVITLFLAKFVLNDVAPWCQPAAVVCSLVTVAFLLATAVADPGIVVEGAEGGEGREYCEECSIWIPGGAEHCEECGVCILDMDHHCPWMGKCVGRGNILWFRLFNGSWIVFLSFLLIFMPYANSHKETSTEP